SSSASGSASTRSRSSRCWRSRSPMSSPRSIAAISVISARRTRRSLQRLQTPALPTPAPRRGGRAVPINPQEFLLLAPEILLAGAGLLLLLVGTVGRGLGNRESV